MSKNPFHMSSQFQGKKLHLGVSGSVACYKVCDLARVFIKIGVEVSASLSEGARAFLTPMLFEALGARPVYGDMFASGDVFAHLRPGREADCFCVAPASADILAQMANGLARDMLAAQYVAYPGPCVVAPAMNPKMWAHAATKANVGALVERGVQLIPPGVGGVADGEEGQGRLAEIEEIFLGCLKAMAARDMAGQKVMLTMGPTREFWDGVRFWSNPSSGRMGAALATCAWLRGASVTAIVGPDVEVFMPSDIKRINVISANDMLAAARDIWPRADIGLFSAAVADFAPMRPAEGGEIKFKKTGASDGLDLKFSHNPDILAACGAHKRENQKILGFAAEITPDMAALLPLAKGKLQAKHADLLAANRVNEGKGAFAADAAAEAVVDRTGKEEIWEPMPKADIAWKLLSWLLTL